MREIRTIILVLAGMVTALLIGAVGATPMITTIQTAEADVKCTAPDESGDYSCSGGEGFGGVVRGEGGGFGTHTECDEDGDCFESGGEGGRGCGVSPCIVGGQGAHVFCGVDRDCDPGPGGSGVHAQGPGGNSGR